MMVFLISIISLGAVSAADDDAVSTDALQITGEVTADEPVIAESDDESIDDEPIDDEPIDDEPIDDEPSNVVQKNITLESDEELSFEYGDEIILNVTSENSIEDMTASIKDTEDNLYDAEVDGNNILLGVMPIGQYTLNITTSNITKLFDLSIIKASPTLSIEVNPQYYVDEDVYVLVTMPSKVDGLVVAEIDGIKKYCDLYNGNAYFFFEDLIADNYTVTAKYWGNENYNAYINETEFEVIKRNAKFNLNIEDYGDNSVSFRTYFVDEYGDEDSSVYGTILFIVDGVEHESYVDEGYDSFYLEDLKRGNHTVEVQFLETYRYLSYNVTENFTVKNVRMDAGFEYDDIGEFGENVLIYVNLPQNATGNITVTIDGKNYTQKVVDGRVDIIISGLEVGDYNALVEYSGDEYYDAADSTLEFSIDPLSDKIRASSHSIFADEEVSYEINLANKNATGNISIIVNGEKYETALLENGTANITLSNLTVGYKEIEIQYSDDEGVDKSWEFSLMVKQPLNPVIITAKDITFDDTAKITIEFNDTISKDIIIIILDDFSIDEFDYNNGIATFNASNLTIGEHNVTVSLFDEYEYESIYVNSTVFNVTKLNTAINATAKDITEGETATVEVNVDEKATGIVLADIGGKKSYAEISNGKAAITVDALKEGNYTVSVTYIGDEKYTKANTTTKFQVKAKAAENTTGNDTPKAPENITVVVNGNNYTAELVNGTAIVNIPENTTGNDTPKAPENITVVVNGNNYTAELVNGTAIVNIPENTTGNDTPAKTDLNVTVPNTINAGENATVNVKAPVNATGNVTVKVDGKEVATAQLVNGTADINLANLTKGAHIVEVTYGGNTVASAIAVNDVVNPTPVTKKDTIILANATLERVANEHTKTGENGTDYFVTLKDADGNALVNKTVQIAINGVHYYVQTDENGSAHQTVSMESANVYTYAFAFQGDDEYNAAPLNSTRLTVIKKATTLTAAKKVTFKKSAKTKKVTVTLGTVKNADGKVYLASGKTVTLKVNGKTYKAKTNAKNQAVFKVKLTKKNTYKATVKFAGSKIYDSSKTSLKIVVK